MNNPALKIWTEGQLVYGVLHGIAILLSIPASFLGLSDSASSVAIISVFSVLMEFCFALPAVPLLALLLKYLQSLKNDKPTNLFFCIVGYGFIIYICARVLWRCLHGHWEVRSAEASFFSGFTAVALVSALAAVVMNKRRLYDYTCIENSLVADTSEKPEHATITPETDNHES